eukprot:m.17302 g.17302  ORF g.17302 m.17302 type:complete len:88 (+) comp27429_c0_seq1:4320-4583(+)
MTGLSIKQYMRDLEAEERGERREPRSILVRRSPMLSNNLLIVTMCTLYKYQHLNAKTLQHRDFFLSSALVFAIVLVNYVGNFDGQEI